jgi:hypothetical protein
LGINTVRDSLTSYGEAKPVLDAMAAAGIKFDFTTPGQIATSGSAALASYVEALKTFQADHPGSIISVEGLNEANSDGAYTKAFTMEAAAAFQKALYTAVKGTAGLSDVSVLNLSISHDSLEAYKALGDLGQYSDYANAHAYPHTGVLNDASMQASMDLASAASKGDPIVVTETGYTTLTSALGVGASETAQAKLILNNLLNAYENGSQKTYIFTLFDLPSAAYRGEMEVHFGLFNADGSPKMAANTVHNFTTILSSGDTGGATAGTTVNYSLTNAPAETHSMVMQKSGGVYDLVVWTDKLVWNDITGKDLVTPSADVTVNLGKIEPLVYVYDPLKGIEPIAVYRNVQSIKIPLSDHALIIEVGAQGPVTEAAPSTPADLTMTAAQFVAQIDTLAQAPSLHSITLTDEHVLKVSSVETMAYMISKYGALLSKIDGDVTFSVSFGQATWRKVQTFDETGKLLTRTDYGIANGKVVSEAKINADKSVEYTAFGIAGKSYTTETKFIDPSGKITEVVRKHADGTLDYREVAKADGSKDYLYYTAKGVLQNDVTVGTDGSRITLTYDPATTKLVRNITEDKNGNVTTTSYTGGVKASVDTVMKSGLKETVTYDLASGKVVTDVVTNANGSGITKTYVNGVLSRQYEKNIDGTQKNSAFDITGQSYSIQIQTVDAKGKIVDLVRKHTDGTMDYREITKTDGSKEYVYYNTKGALLNDVTVNADGSRVTLTYDPATGKLIRNISSDKDGNLTTTTYSAGVKASVDSVAKSGVKETVTFDAATGKIATDAVTNADGSGVTKVYVNGVLSRQYEKNLDGSQKTSAFDITGKTYAIQIQTVDAKGKIVDLVRKHTDGTMDYREITKTDGSKEYVYYNTKGALLNDVTVNPDGSRVTLTYDPATSKLVRNISSDKDGNITTTNYTAGAKSAVDTVMKSGLKGTVTFDAASGKMMTDSATSADGSNVTKVYVNEVLSRQFEKNVDGTQKISAFDITGKTYTIEVQTLDTKGKVVDLVRKHTDGTLDYRELVTTDGSKEYLYYNAKGALLNDVTVNTDGSRVTLNYDAASAKLASSMTVDKAGNVVTTTYTGGNKASVETVLKAGGSEQVTFNTANGKILTDAIKNADGSAVTKVYVDGTLSRQFEKNIDGTQKSSAFDITGKSYTIETQLADANGKVIELVRQHADGSMDYQEKQNADGSKHFAFYTAKGSLTADVSVAANGDRTTLTYDPVTSKMTQAMVERANGALDVRKFVDGVLMNQTTKNVDGSTDFTSFNKVGLSYTTEHQTVDKMGNLLLIERLHADGTFDYKEVRGLDGSKQISSFTAAGEINTHVTINADKSRSVDTYLKDGTGDIRTDAYDSAIKLLVTDLLHRDGSHAVSVYADGQTFHGGAGNDTIQFRTTIKGDFVYDGGRDTLSSFNLTAGSQDQIVLDHHWATSMSDLHMAQVGKDTVVTFDSGNSITLEGVSAGSVEAGHFIFI